MRDTVRDVTTPTGPTKHSKRQHHNPYVIICRGSN